MKNTFSNPLYCTISLLISLCFSCKKNSMTGGDHNSGYFTPATPPTPISTNLGVYVYNNSQFSNPLQVSNNSNGISASIDYVTSYDGFFAGPLSVDKYLSHLVYGTTLLSSNLGFPQYKSYNASSPNKNYVGVKMLPFTNAGNVKNLGGAVTLNLPGNGTLAFPAESFSSQGIEMNYDIYVNYLDPTAPDFAVSLPNLSFADESTVRLFLDSYGIYQIRPILSYCNCNILSSEDLFAKNVTLQMPIPASMMATSPDSIDAWHLEAHSLIWRMDGFAYKKNGFYEKQIRQYGIWNFAKSEDAVYLNLQLRTTEDIAIPNTRFVVKNNSREIVEGRTDMEGNALVLAPFGTPLTFNIIDDHYFNYLNIQLADQSLGSFNHESTVKIVLSDRKDIGTLEGTVHNCDGSSFGNGSVLISQRDAKDDYVVPIKSGKFVTANWLHSSFGNTKLSFRDANGAPAFEVNTYLASEYISHLKRLKEDFYSCPTNASLYCYYQFDSKSKFTIQGDVSHSSPTLIARLKPGTNDIIISDGNNGISFSMWILGGPTGVVSTGLPLTINNVVTRYDPNGNSEFIIYRNDAQPNGFMEGWFAIDYLDASNAPHTATGNFRLKISN